jgi:methylmalonyl-CoA mutase N-terminal domain/subunit
MVPDNEIQVRGKKSAGHVDAMPCQTSGVCLVQQEPLNNVVRSACHALAAVLGGAQSLHVDSYDEAYSAPTEETALLSLRTQQIIQKETGINISICGI